MKIILTSNFSDSAPLSASDFIALELKGFIQQPIANLKNSISNYLKEKSREEVGTIASGDSNNKTHSEIGRIADKSKKAALSGYRLDQHGNYNG